jgi:exonuclease III
VPNLLFTPALQLSSHCLQLGREVQERTGTGRGISPCTGDFNLICSEGDKNNQNLDMPMMGRFRRWINGMSLKEIPLHGRQFTWSNSQANPTLVRLDRVFCSVDWEDLFPDCLLNSTQDSDHCPLILGLHDVKRGKRRFHFEAFWMRILPVSW